MVFRNGTGSGGSADDLNEKKCDFEHAVDRKLIFQHGETSKQLIIRVNPDCQVGCVYNVESSQFNTISRHVTTHFDSEDDYYKGC